MLAVVAAADIGAVRRHEVPLHAQKKHDGPSRNLMLIAAKASCASDFKRIPRWAELPVITVSCALSNAELLSFGLPGIASF